MTFNAAYFLDASTRRDPEAIALIHDGRRYSYRRLHDMANRVANGLTAAGFGRGSRIALCCYNRPGFYAAYFGAMKIGACLITMDPFSKYRDFVNLLNDCEAEALFCFDGFPDRNVAAIALDALAEVESCRRTWIIPADPFAPSTVPGVPALGDLMRDAGGRFETRAMGPDEPAVVFYTSGTTGKRKGVMASQANLCQMAMITMPLAPAEDCRRRLIAQSLECAIGQMYSVITTAFCGHTAILLEDEDPDYIWRELIRERANYVTGMPYFFKQLIDHSAGLDDAEVRKSLRLCPTGGTHLPKDWSDMFEERFGARILPGYGASEVTTAISWTCPKEPYKPGSSGRPIPGIDVRILDPDMQPVRAGEQGQIVVRSPGLMLGYLGMPAATEAVIHEGCYLTRDLGSFDDEGCLVVHGRMDEKIIRGIDHIDPAEVELLLLEHPCVAQAAVVAIPHPDLGQEAKAFVVLEDERAARADDLLSWLADELPDEKGPGLLELVSSLPLTRTGKIARHLLT